MQLSNSGATFVRLQEGFVDHWYADPGGVGTIGEGFTWASAAFRDWWALHRPGQTFGPGAGMTRAEADDCLIYVMGRDFGLSVQRFLGHDVPGRARRRSAAGGGRGCAGCGAAPGTELRRRPDALSR